VALDVVAAETVGRSPWPNLSRDQLVERARAWADREGHELAVVFDGEPPEHAPDLVGSTYADDAIAAAVERADGPVWVVTSDRELRGRVESRAEQILGGGSFVREI
jgi:hypothetical protein